MDAAFAHVMPLLVLIAFSLLMTIIFWNLSRLYGKKYLKLWTYAYGLYLLGLFLYLGITLSIEFLLGFNIFYLAGTLFLYRGALSFCSGRSLPRKWTFLFLPAGISVLVFFLAPDYIYLSFYIIYACSGFLLFLSGLEFLQVRERMEKVAGTFFIIAGVLLGVSFLSYLYPALQPAFFFFNNVIGATLALILITVFFYDNSRELMELEKRVNHEARRFMKLVENQDEGVAIIGCSGTIEFINTAGAKILGFSQDDLRGKDLKIFTEDKEPEDFLGPDWQLKTVHEKELPRGDGEKILIRLNAIPKGHGSLETLVIFTDITEARRTENALLASEIMYRNTVENAGTAMAIVEEDDHISMVNNQMEILSGYTREELLGKCWKEFVHQEDAEIIKNLYWQLREDKEQDTVQFEAQILTREGIKKEVLTNLRVIQETGQVILSLIDISERKQMEEELKTRKNKIERLHEKTLRMERAKKEEEVCQLIVESAENILDLTACAVDILEGDMLVVKARSEGSPDGIYKDMPVHEGLAGKAFRSGETILTGDARKNKDARPVKTDLRSALTIPIGEMGVFQAVSEEVNAFTREDVELGEVLISHATEALKRIRFEEEIRYMSFHDKLTNTYNRAFFEEEMKRLDTDRHLPLSVIMGDVNGLKLVNDAFGHEEGDRVLGRIAQILKDCCHNDCVVSRWGGDEFAILLPSTSEKECLEICQCIRENCEEIGVSNPVPISISLGIASKENTEYNMMTVLKEAEEGMYRNKLFESTSFRSYILKFFEKTLYEKSSETEEHASRLQQMAVRIGEEIGLSEKILDELSLLAALHDIGKIALPEEIIKKPGPLNKEEWDIIKRHPEIGYRIADSIPELRSITEGILFHHEWWNGEGYPKGLVGEEIPLISRIISIVDAYDVMITGRPYKKAVEKENVIEELKRSAGQQFDPELVEIFIKLIEEGEI